MRTLLDILKRTAFMALFFMPIPFGSYTLHSGSSAVVALVTFLLLSLGVPLAYTSYSFSGFGPKYVRVRWWSYLIGWMLMHFLVYYGFTGLDLSLLWSAPSWERDIIFLVVMYVQVAISLWIACCITRLVCGDEATQEPRDIPKQV